MYSKSQMEKVLRIGKNLQNTSRCPKMKIGRNSLCPCGSGEKYKKCCMTDFSKGPKTMSVNSTNNDLQKRIDPQKNIGNYFHLVESVLQK